MTLRKKLKYVYRVCVAYILLAPFILYYLKDFPLEFSDPYFASTFHGLLLISVPNAVAIAGMCDYMLNADNRYVVTQSLYTFILGSVTFVISLAAWSLSGSDYVDDQLLFKHSQTNDAIIVRLEPFDHSQQIVQVKNLSPAFKWVSQVDTSSLDRSLWIPVPGDQRQIPW